VQKWLQSITGGAFCKLKLEGKYKLKIGSPIVLKVLLAYTLLFFGQTQRATAERQYLDRRHPDLIVNPNFLKH
jgi:hypothetical protein